MGVKKSLGQFFTKNLECILLNHVLDFMVESGKNVLYDPFAGEGDLLNLELPTIDTRVGLDIDQNLGWRYNDSLIDIPNIDNSIIFTNPPYYGKSSAAKHKETSVLRYFEGNDCTDLYQVALERCLRASDYVVAIIPESFINSSFDKSRLCSITTVEENPFTDTDCPICIACFDGNHHQENEIKMYKGNTFVCHLNDLTKYKTDAEKGAKIKFNDKNGWLAIKCIDDIRFGLTSDFDYDFANNIKVSSRTYTLVSVDVPLEKREAFLEKCNKLVNEIRKDTHDLLLTPFKGNKGGKRRRRLDFATTRLIINKVLIELELL